MSGIAVRILVPFAIGTALALAVAATAAAKGPPAIGTIPISDLLAKLDRDGNGCIDLEEGRNYTSRRFHALDSNGDENLDATEAPRGPGETTNSRPITIEAWQDAYHARFDSFDADHNGCVTPAEAEAGRAALAAGGH